jgi:tetratricopeptide (TPR) repeat protein
MKVKILLLSSILMLCISDVVLAQQEGDVTQTAILNKINELNAIKDEGLITETEYKKKYKQLQILLKNQSKVNKSTESTQNVLSEVGAKVNEKYQQPQSNNAVTFTPEKIGGKQEQSVTSNITQPIKSIQPPESVSKIVTLPNPKTVEWNDKSFAGANRGDWADAIRTSSVAISLDPNYAVAYINRCRAFLGHGDMDEAMQDCDTALKLEPRNMLAVNNRGAILFQQGKQDAALAEYEKACVGGLELGCDNFRNIRGYSPTDKVAIAKIKLDEAQAKFADKNWNGAIASSTEAINIISNNVNAYVTRSGAYANVGQLPEAIADAESAIRLNPDEGLGYNNRGYVYELMKKTRQAVLDYEIACSLKAAIGCTNLKRIKQ